MTQNLLVGLFMLSLSVSPLVAGVVVKTDGKRIPDVSILSTSFDEVRYRIAGITRIQKLPAEKVATIIYGRDHVLQDAEQLIDRSDWEGALAAFRRAGRDPLLEEASAFGQAVVVYRRCVESGPDLRQAIVALDRFIDRYTPRKGFHVPAALFLSGEAYLEAGDRDKASTRFQELAEFRGESRGILAALGQGQLALAAGEPAKATTLFAKVLRQAKELRMTLFYHRGAVWYGRALVARGLFGRASEFLEKQIGAMPPMERHANRYAAQAQNLLGDAHAGLPESESQWQALFAYLRTTALYPEWRAECAEGLFKAWNLARKLARTSGLQDDPRLLLQRLCDTYGDTVWAKAARDSSEGVPQAEGSLKKPDRSQSAADAKEAAPRS